MDNPATAGEHLRRLRHQAQLSQLDLALITGVSQRHLSCLETGRAKPSPGTLHNLLSALQVPLDQCNRVFLAAGFARVMPPPPRLAGHGGHSRSGQPCAARQQPRPGDSARQ